MAEIIQGALRRRRDFLMEHTDPPSELWIDRAAHKRLTDEVKRLHPDLDVLNPTVGLTHICGMRIVVVDRPEWLEAR